MDVILPQMIWIGNRCYRKNPLLSHDGSSDNTDLCVSQQGNQLVEASEYDEYEDACEKFVPMEKLGDGRYRSKMTIASEYFSKIIGRNGDSKRIMEKDTKTQIFIPKKGQSGDIAITGFNPKDVTSAYVRISLLVSNARKKMPFTHFISIPLTNPDVKTRFNQFKTDVLKFSRGTIDESLFQNSEKVHLTIGTLVLLTNDDRARAAQVLHDCIKKRFRDIIGSSPIEIQIQGVEYMNDDPERVDILYGKCLDNSGRLQKLADKIVDTLEEEGLLDRQYDHVKLHATLMNSQFKMKDDSEQSYVRSTFNAKPILEKWKNYEFGSVSVDYLHLSQRYSTSQSTKYYVASTQVALNE